MATQTKLILTISCPTEELDVYLEDVVFPQVLEGMVAGHTDSSTHWDSTREED
jgi:hypothetical protein